jgi:hypothetical protein
MSALSASDYLDGYFLWRRVDPVDIKRQKQTGEIAPPLDKRGVMHFSRLSY